jgi:ribosomal-protein-alanine N-acetyltransferase
MEDYLFETDRLLVRKLTQDDADLLYKYSQEEITKIELPDEVFEDIIETRRRIECFLANYDHKYPLVSGIIQKENKIIIGHLSLSEIDKGVEIGYAIATNYQDRKYLSEIIIPFLSWIKINLNIKKIYGIAKKDNVASWKILEKSGFELEDEGIYKNYFGGNHIVKIYSKNIK